MITTVYRICPFCQVEYALDVDHASLRKWVERDLPIQEAFPNASADLREQILTGTHPVCWDEMFGDDVE